jgi:hypothetical protein
MEISYGLEAQFVFMELNNMKYTKWVANCETGEQYEELMTNEEILGLQKDQQEYSLYLEKIKKEEEDKNNLRESAIQKLISLGLSREEAEVFKI